MAILHSYSASYIKWALASKAFPVGKATSVITYYRVSDIRETENASLFFTRNAETNEHIVMKILLPFKDIRYSLERRNERQDCQFDGLQWNRMFAKDIYIGLAPIYDPEIEKQIGIGEILIDPKREELDLDAEYALLMKELPKERRLGNLLKRGNGFSNRYYAHVLARYMDNMHRKLEQVSMSPIYSANGQQWGSTEQLKDKLEHNFSFVDRPSPSIGEGILKSEPYRSLKAFSRLLNGKLSPIFSLSEYQEYFKRRMEEQHIRHCHGDLKARNIWIMPFDNQNDEALWEKVKVLDAVDFNPMYSMIDILSDFAMLVVDVHVRTDSYEIADVMLEDYLRLTRQQDKASRSVLNYYIVEKAFIGAIVNILYDDKPELGLVYLRVAERRLEDLKR